MTTEFKKRLAVEKRQASRSLSYNQDQISEITRQALNNVKNQFELNLWYDYKSVISTLSYNGEIAMRKGAIEAFKFQFGL